MTAPCYQDELVTLYHGDCRELLADLAFDVVVTDPPYAGAGYEERFDWPAVDLAELPPPALACRGFWFWDGSPFPIEWTAQHIWSKANRNVGASGELYESIFERNGGTTGRVLRHAVIDSPMNAVLNGDVYLNHPTQKPIRLVRRLVAVTRGVIVDPFAGSGTTLRAAKDLRRRAIGIEVSRTYCQMAVDRLRQEVLPL